MYELLNSKITKDLVTQTQDHTTPRDSKLKSSTQDLAFLWSHDSSPRQAAGLRLPLPCHPRSPPRVPSLPFVAREADPLSVDGPAPRAYIAPTAFEQAREAMSENGRRPERIRRETTREDSQGATSSESAATSAPGQAMSCAIPIEKCAIAFVDTAHPFQGSYFGNLRISFDSGGY